VTAFTRAANWRGFMVTSAPQHFYYQQVVSDKKKTKQKKQNMEGFLFSSKGALDVI